VKLQEAELGFAKMVYPIKFTKLAKKRKTPIMENQAKVLTFCNKHVD
jgi:hypothetical protein